MPRSKIVLADDDRLILATLAAGLRDAGYEIFEAANGEEALRLCVTESPDLVILDIRMPGKSGVETARDIRRRTSVTCLFLSAYEDADIMQAAVAEGASGYLMKPLDVAQIIAAIESALRARPEPR